MTDPTAVMGRRIFAYVIDGFIGFIIIAALFVPIAEAKADTQTFSSNAAASDYCGEINERTFGTDGSGGSFESDWTPGRAFPDDSVLCLPLGTTTYRYTGADVNSISNQLQLISLVATGLNLLVLQGLTGASVGKFATGVRVVREDGSTVGFGWNLLRWLLLFVDSFCFALVGLITAFSSKGHRRVGDMAASTFVVGKAAVGSPIQVPGMTTPYPATAWPPTPGQAGYQPQQSFPTPVDGPTWDNARNTYIQYDREVGAWVQWDDIAKAWRPIDQ